MFIIGLALVVAGLFLFILAHHKASTQAFFEDSPLTLILGIYYWGQGLVIAPFWVLVGLMAMFLLLPLDLLRLYLLFHIFRSSYEILYWLTHKPSDDLKPPLMGHLADITQGEHLILYQLAQLTLVFMLTFLLINL